MLGKTMAAMVINLIDYFYDLIAFVYDFDTA